MATPRLTVEIAASEAKFQADLGKAVKHAEMASKQIGVAMSGLKGLIAGALSGISIAAFVGLIKGSIDAADRLNDLSQQTGVAVETLGGIGFAAKQAGSDLDGVAKAFGKFNLEIAKAAGGDSEAAQAFKLIGISVKELQDVKPDEVLARVADKFATYADGPQKAALANEFFKKGYQELIPLLNGGGEELRANIEYFKTYSGLTDDLAKKSDAFNDSIEKAKLLNGAFGNVLAAQLLPSLQGLINAFVDSKEKGDGFVGTATAIVDGMKVLAKGAAIVVLGIQNVGDALAALVAKGVALSEGRFKDAFVNIDREREAKVKELQESYRKIADAIDGKGATAGVPRPKPTGRAPSIPGKAGGGGEDVAKRVLDQALRNLENSIKEEQEILRDREHFLQIYFQDDQIGIRDYFARRQSIISEAVDKQKALYDDEIKALQAFASKAGPKDRIDTETKIADVVAKRAKLEQDAAIKSIDLWFEQKRAAKEFRNEVEEITIRLAGMAGDSVGAGLAEFDRANEKFRARATLQAQDPATSAEGQFALRQLEDLRNRTALQLNLNKVQSQFRGILEDVGIAEANINLSQRSGAITTLDAINKRSELAKANIGLLEQEAAAYQALAQSLPAGEARNEALRTVQRLKLEIDQLALSAQELERVFTDIFTGAVSDGLTDMITGTKSVKEAFKDMERQIVSSITRIASQNIAESLLGKSGAGSGVGDFFASLFGGGGSGASGGGIGDFIGKLFGGLSGFAAGGPVAANEPIWVGEKGKEVFVPKAAGTIVPNHAIKRGGGNTVIVNSYAMPGASRTTADQAAMRSGIAAQRALARNG